MRIIFLLLSLLILNGAFVVSVKLLTFDENSKKLDHAKSIQKEYSIYYTKETDSFEIKQQIIEGDDALATAIYTNSLFEIGWDTLYLTVRPNSIVDEKLQAYAAGYLEGAITTKRIYDYSVNILHFHFGPTRQVPDNVLKYFTQHQEYLTSYEKENINSTDQYKKIVINVYNQYKGMLQGYNENTEYKKFTQAEFFTIVGQGDIRDILFYENYPNFEDKTEEYLFKYHRDNSHCSAFIKMKADYSDLFFSQNMWFSYSSQMRIMKTYTYNFQYAGEHRKQSITISSYPATLASNDDFYMLSNDLIIMETTNPILNGKLYENLTPNSFMTCYRVVVANLLANDSNEWVNIYIENNSGTYNNQYMVLDLNKVDTDKKIIHDKALMIVEQIPGYYDINDVTEFLRMGYWPSYNVPYSMKIRQLSSYVDFTAKFPNLFPTFDYDTCSRANIFRRDGGSVQSIEDLKRFMRYNKYQTDELSLGNPWFTIAGRADLIDDSQYSACYGVTDVKAGSIKEVKGKENKMIHIIAGPTNDDQETFDWNNSKACENTSHQGMPDVYNFKWINYYTTPNSN